MEINTPKYCHLVAEAVGKQDRSVQLDYVIQHLDWLELYSSDSNAVRSLGMNIIANFGRSPDSPFFNDERILRVCLSVGRLSRHVGLKGVMKQISDRGQFAKMPKFYIHWAEIYGSEGDRIEFEKIYGLALERKAEPVELIEKTFNEMRLKYFGTLGETVDENTQVLFAPKLSMKDPGEQKKDAHSPLALRGTSFTEKFYCKAMQDFSNTLPVVPPRAQECQDDTITTSVERSTKCADKENRRSNFKVYVDEDMEVDADIETAGLNKRTVTAVTHNEKSSNITGDGLDGTFTIKGGHGDCVESGKGETTVNFEQREAGDRGVFALPKSTVSSLLPKGNGHGQGLGSQGSECNFLDTASEEVVAGTYVFQGRAGIAASTPANPLAPTIAEHMHDLSLQQERSNDLDVIFPTNNRDGGSVQLTAFEQRQRAMEKSKSNLTEETVTKQRINYGKQQGFGGNSLVNAVNFLKIDSVHEDEEDERTGCGLKSLIRSEVNPWDDKVRQKIMLAHRVYPTYLHDCTTRMKRICAGTTTVFEGEQFNILEIIGQGGFAKVFRSVSEDGSTYAIKVESPSCRWEVYVCELLRTRLPQWVLAGVMSVHDAYIYPNLSAIVYEYYPLGDIIDLANSLSSMRASNTGLLCVYLSLQIARILNEVHKAQIIHADIKPDNFMILKKLDEMSSVEELLDEKNFTIKLIDWGRAIDMSAMKGRTFSGRAGTEYFDCFEMLDGRPWTYQVDYFGFIATMHVILFGTYMKTMRDEGTKKYSMVSVIKRRCTQRDVLQDVFQMCLNIPDCDHLPDWNNIIKGLAESVRYTLTNDRMEWKNCARDFNQAVSSRPRRRCVGN